MRERLKRFFIYKATHLLLLSDDSLSDVSYTGFYDTTRHTRTARSFYPRIDFM